MKPKFFYDSVEADIPVPSEADVAVVRRAFEPLDPEFVKNLRALSQSMGFIREYGDPHTQTADLVFRVHPDQVTLEMRRDARTINFGVLYGKNRK